MDVSVVVVHQVTGWNIMTQLIELSNDWLNENLLWIASLKKMHHHTITEHLISNLTLIRLKFDSKLGRKLSSIGISSKALEMEKKTFD